MPGQARGKWLELVDGLSPRLCASLSRVSMTSVKLRFLLSFVSFGLPSLVLCLSLSLKKLVSKTCRRVSARSATFMLRAFRRSSASSDLGPRFCCHGPGFLASPSVTLGHGQCCFMHESSSRWSLRCLLLTFFLVLRSLVLVRRFRQ